VASAMLLGATLLVSPAFSQGSGGPPPQGGGAGQGSSQGGKGGDLGGPPVAPGAHEGDGNFGGAGKPGKGGKGGQGPGGMGGMGGDRNKGGRAWMITFKEIQPSLTDDQKSKTEQMKKDFEAKSEAWRKENGEKMKELAEQARGASASGGKPDQAVMDQLKQLNESRPKVEELQKQVFGTLTPDQQNDFKQKLAANEAKLKAEMVKRGAGGPDGDKGKGKGDKKGDIKDGGDKPPTDGNGNPPPPPMDQ